MAIEVDVNEYIGGPDVHQSRRMDNFRVMMGRVLFPKPWEISGTLILKSPFDLGSGKEVRQSVKQKEHGVAAIIRPVARLLLVQESFK